MLVHTATSGLSKRHICQESSKWRPQTRWAAVSQDAEWASTGPQHISSSEPTEFESMLGEAADLAPEGVEHPLQYLRCRVLARHIHAMLKRGVTLVTVCLEPSM